MLPKLAGIAVLMMLVVATSACTTTTTNEGQTQAATGQPALNVTAKYLGSTTSLNSSLGTPTTAASGNKFVTYAVYCQNINAKDLDMGNPNFLKLRDTEGNIYAYDIFTYSLTQKVSNKTLKGLSVQMGTQPGDKYSGLITFQIPTNAKPKSLTYDDRTSKITINL